jgi:hypothetical protein
LAADEDNTTVHGSAPEVVDLGTNYLGPSHFLFQGELFSPDVRKNWVCDSVRTLGSFAHRGPIPLAAITRISVLDNRDAFGFLIAAVDAIQKTQGGVGLTDAERQLGPPLTRWLNGDDVSVDEFPAILRPNIKSIEYIKARIAVGPSVFYERS